MGGGASWDGLLGNSLGRVHRWVAVDVGPRETVMQVKAKVARHPAYRALAAASAASLRPPTPVPAATLKPSSSSASGRGGSGSSSRPVSRSGPAEAMTLVLPGGQQVHDDSALLHQIVENGPRSSSGHNSNSQSRSGAAAPGRGKDTGHNPLWAPRPELQAASPHPLDPFKQNSFEEGQGQGRGQAAAAAERNASSRERNRKEGPMAKMRNRLVTLYAGRGELPERQQEALVADKYFYDAAVSNAAGQLNINQPSAFLAEFFVSPPAAAEVAAAAKDNKQTNEAMLD